MGWFKLQRPRLKSAEEWREMSRKAQASFLRSLDRRDLADQAEIIAAASPYQRSSAEDILDAWASQGLIDD
jgi:hypothetical protein